MTLFRKRFVFLLLTLVLFAFGATVIADEGYTWDSSSGTLTVTTNAGTTAWRSDTEIVGAAQSAYDAVKNLVLNDSITEIGKDAFSGCKGITSPITLPNGLTTIGNDAFYNCKGLSGGIVFPSLISIGTFAFYNSDLAGELAIPAGVATKHLSFGGTKITSLTVSEDSYVGSSSFYSCSSLTTIDISGTGVGENAFRYASKLTEAKLNNAAMELNTTAFDDCAAINDLTVPNGTLKLLSDPVSDGKVYIGIGDSLSEFTINAEAVSGKAFLKWTGADTGIDDADSAVTIYTMPASAGTVTLTANFVDFTPATGINGVPTTGTAGTDLTLVGTVAPDDATSTTIVWSVSDAGTTGATIKGDVLSTTAGGTVVVQASIAGGTSPTIAYTQTFSIAIAAVECTLTLDANGGSVNPTSLMAIIGQTATLPTPTRSGYSFLGWYTLASGGEKITDSTLFTEDVTLYAQWNVNSSYIAPNPGNSGSSSTTTTTTENKTTVPTLAVEGENLPISEIAGGQTLSVSMSGIQRRELIKASDDNVVFDVSSFETEGGEVPTALRLTRTDLQQMAKADKGVEVSMKQGSVVLDSEALTSLANQLSSNVEVSLEQVEFSQLNDAQQQQMQHVDSEQVLIVDISIRSGSAYITEFEGLITVTIPWNGAFNENLTVWYIAADGTMTEVPCSYDEAAGTISFTTNHLSLYAVGYAAAADAKTDKVPSEPETKPTDDDGKGEEAQPDSEDASEDSAIILLIGSNEVLQGDTVLEAPPVAPQIINDRTMLPFRYLIQTLLGGSVDWDEDTRTVAAEVNGVTFLLTIDDEQMIIDDEAVAFDQAPVIVDGYTLVPLRVFEAAVQSITWDADNRSVAIVR